MSGTGPVAEGVQFTDGSVALRWYGDYPTTTVWDGIESVVAIHGHGGATEVEWIDPESGPDPGLTLPPRETLAARPWPDLHSAPEPEDPDPLHHERDSGSYGGAPPGSWSSYRVFR
ncbi:hypothetical protein ACFVWG_25215 [Kribbella sp. NPDC058245]|uniref:hypothetical protein n=1 Tax=Kribbella sp. NPDC058245 TaxID=3346399 RepID=UPI0036E55058